MLADWSNEVVTCLLIGRMMWSCDWLVGWLAVAITSIVGEEWEV